jgi:hypothetical protein
MRSESEVRAQQLLEAVDQARDVLAEIYAKHSTKIGPFATQAQVMNTRLRVARLAFAEALASQGEQQVAGAPQLVRYGRAGEGSQWLLVPMEDGYWTPWHVAQAALAARQPVGQPRVSAYRFIQKGQALQHTVWLDGDAGETYVQAERDGVGRIERAYSAPPVQPQAPDPAITAQWESGELGRSDEHVVVAGEQHQAPAAAVPDNVQRAADRYGYLKSHYNPTLMWLLAERREPDEWDAEIDALLAAAPAPGVES